MYSYSSAFLFEIPLGSVLGPIIIFVCALSDIINHDSISHVSFADDTQFYQLSLFAEVDDW